MGKGRLAPSPSGRMHLGNAFSALLAWLSARAAGDSVVLRLEDLDPQRCRPEYCAGVEEDFRWLGLDWDEGGLAGGDRYRQSRRGDYYAACLARLGERGLLYPCFCSRGELHAASAPHRSDGVFIYPGTCRDLTPEERARRAKDRAPAVRIRVPRQALRVVTETVTDKETGLETEVQRTGVYTVVGTQAEFQEVSVLYTDDNFYLVEPIDSSAARRRTE